MADGDLNERIAARVREARAARGLTLAALAEASGVSRSMISLIERGESSPTAVVLDRLAAGLGVTLASLFEPPSAPPDPVSRRQMQVEWRDPASGYLRRNVSPGGFASPIQIVEVTLPPGARVSYETGLRPAAVNQQIRHQQDWHQQIWVLQGVIEVVVGGERYELASGDCLAFVLDRPTAYHNSAARPARYAVVAVAQRTAR